MADTLLPIVAIVGPTASGKTDAAIAVSQALDGEVISMDSMQVYRGMDIGTAKPTLAERGGVTHHLLDVVSPDVPFSVAAYRELADAAIQEIHGRGKLPVLAGGTGLYLNALTLEMDFAQANADASIREQLQRESDSEGGKERLFAQLALVDPASAKRLHVNDVRRVVRALEIFRVTGKTMTEHAADYRMMPRRYLPIIVGIGAPRNQLYGRIDARVLRMIQAGLLQEVQALLAQQVPLDSQAMQAIGYRELIAVLTGKAALPDAIAGIKQATRQYAKRQFTWFRRDDRVHWFERADGVDVSSLHLEIIAYVRDHLARFAPSTAED